MAMAATSARTEKYGCRTKRRKKMPPKFGNMEIRSIRLLEQRETFSQIVRLDPAYEPSDRLGMANKEARAHYDCKFPVMKIPEMKVGEAFIRGTIVSEHYPFKHFKWLQRLLGWNPKEVHQHWSTTVKITIDGLAFPTLSRYLAEKCPGEYVVPLVQSGWSVLEYTDPE
jgi:hypothetical protein